jgi:hypothetical protein
VTAYLIAENVLREFGARGNANVRKWLATVDDADLRLSVATLFEKRRGAEELKRRDPQRAAEWSPLTEQWRRNTHATLCESPPKTLLAPFASGTI